MAPIEGLVYMLILLGCNAEEYGNGRNDARVRQGL